MAGDHGSDVFHHVRDSQVIELPGGVQIPLWSEGWGEVGLTKFMLLQVLAGLVVLWIFRGLAKRTEGGQLSAGRWWNFWEVLALYVRDEIVRPTIGEGHHDDHGHAHGGDVAHRVHSVGIGNHMSDDAASEFSVAAVAGGYGEIIAPGHPADKHLPFLWTMFFYILVLNLFGAFPLFGAATGNINVTAVLALAVFVYVLKQGISQSGFWGFWKSLVPSMDLPFAIALFLVPLIWVIEFAGLLIKHVVLAIRLFANMMAGHTVLFVFLSFIATSAQAENPWLWYLVTPASVAAQLAISALELFVAFLQAYVFTFLATLFISAAVNPH